jgi:threonylcarbamoyladenosine tRNA methylthiotransferase MtaB
MSTPTKKVAFHTLGCKLNFSETSTISREFINHGFEKVKYSGFADLYIINTCSVTDNADKEARKLIRQAKKRNPNSAIAIIGCYAQLKPESIAKIDGVDLVLGAEEKFNLIKYLDKIDLNKTSATIIQSEISQTKEFMPSYSFGERTRSYLKVQDGCDYTCSFCTIPQARGASRSDSVKKTKEIAMQISKTDIREIVLTGVNIGDFGKNKAETFLDLIFELDTLENIDRIRISSIEPNLLTNEIIQFCYNSKKFTPHFHVPLQSGSNKILKLMRRRYFAELYKERIEFIKSINPNTCIGVDVIVGFPGEEEEDFLKTYEFINSLDISYLHVFTYSERPNTDALKIDKIVPKEERSKRSKMLHILSDKKKRSFYESFTGNTKPVLFESYKNEKLIGHSDNYIKVEVNGPKELINTIRDVKLIKNQGNIFQGVICK